MANHIFISYSRKDSDFAEDLKKKLEAANVEVWTDKSRLVPGEDWQKGIDQAIKDSLALITVMTPTAKASQYVTYEWAFAQGINEGTAAASPIHPKVKIIPILLKPTSLHPQLNKLLYFDFTDYTKQPWNELTNFISELSETVKDIPTYEALGRIGEAAVPALIKVLGDQRPAVRKTAVEALRQIGDVAVPALIKALGDRQPAVRKTAAEELGRIGTAAVPGLIEALDDQQPAMRQRAAEALGRIGEAAAVPALIGALGDQQPAVRKTAAEALRRIGGAAVPALIEALDQTLFSKIQALDHRRPAVYETAAEVLGRIGEAAVPALTEALYDQRLAVRETADRVLEQIKGPRRLVPRLWHVIRSATRRA